MCDDFPMYNQVMNQVSSFCIGAVVWLLMSSASAAQAPAKNSAAAPNTVPGFQHAIALAEGGNCKEALPLLKKAIHQVTDRDVKKRIGLLGLNCAMTHNAPYDPLDFLSVLYPQFPPDPKALPPPPHA